MKKCIPSFILNLMGIVWRRVSLTDCSCFAQTLFPMVHHTKTKPTQKCKQNQQRLRKLIMFCWSFWYFEYCSVKILQKLICTEKIDRWSLARWLGGSFVGRKTVARSVVSGRWLVIQLESQSVCQWSMVWFLSVVGSFVIRWRSDSFEHLVHWKNTENLNLFCKGLLFEKEEKYKTVWMSSLWK